MGAFKPHIWRRATFLFLSCFVQFGLMIQMEFSYSAYFSVLVYEYIVVFKVIYYVVEVFILEPVMRDKLAFAPMVVAISIVSNMTTMGAENFTQFILSFFAGLFLTFGERLYVSPLISEVMSLTPRWMMIERRLRGNKRMTREEKAKEELRWRQINEEIEMTAEGIEPLLDSYCDYSIDTLGLVLSPLVYAQLAIFYDDDKIAEVYAIKTSQIIYYIEFAAMIIPFTLVCDVFLMNAQELIHGWKIFDYLAYQRYRFSVREHRWMMRNIVIDESISEGYQTVDLLCFSSQYYFLMALLSYGILQITLAITAILRLEYVPFADPVIPLMFVIVFLFGEGLILIMKLLADVKIRRLNWRGLWVTKQIEGTVDDDVAAKLAIGEGRQADLEQERLELQALNSERFRHRFLERNRPWILQHLVELLTPRSLDQPGPDGRPALEYVRDVYADLMAMGEGMRRAGDTEGANISSDEEDDLEAARRNWPRNPLTGPALAIARMWLAKARKRRTFGKLIRGILEQNKKSVCEICGRSPGQNKVRLTCLLAINGHPDLSAIDRLILGFENQYSPEELDPGLWKAYFRANAEYCTRCNRCEDAMDQERLLEASRAPGPSRISRAQDISSDEDEDEPEFEPVVVTRTSPEGLMMSKWLLAARKKLGGPFPRPDAKRQMERYAQKLRQAKMKKARDQVKLDVPPSLDGMNVVNIDFNAATKALALRWVRLARDGLESRFRIRSENLREDLENTLSRMPPSDDWFYGSLRLEGADLSKRANNLGDDRKTLEAEAAVKIYKIQNDLNNHVKERDDELNRENKLFQAKVSQQIDRINLDIELRQEELEKHEENKKAEFKIIEKKAREEHGAAPTEMTQSHRNQLIAIDELMISERTRLEKYRDEETGEAQIMFERSQATKKAETERRKAAAGDNVARIRLEVSRRVKNFESEWQGLTAKWLQVAKRKVAVKKKDDEDAKAGKKKKKGGGG